MRHTINHSIISTEIDDNDNTVITHSSSSHHLTDTLPLHKLRTLSTNNTPIHSAIHRLSIDDTCTPILLNNTILQQQYCEDDTVTELHTIPLQRTQSTPKFRHCDQLNYSTSNPSMPTLRAMQVHQQPMHLDDIIENIMVYCDLKTLLHCRRVCKLWYELSHTPYVLQYTSLVIQSNKLFHWSDTLVQIPFHSIQYITNLKLRGDTHKSADGVYIEHNSHALQQLIQLSPHLTQLSIECNCHNVHCQHWLRCFTNTHKLLALTYKRCFSAHDPITHTQQSIILPSTLQRIDLDCISLKSITCAAQWSSQLNTLYEFRLTNILILIDSLNTITQFHTLHEIHLTLKSDAVYGIQQYVYNTLPNLHVFVVHNLRHTTFTPQFIQQFIIQQTQLQYIKLLAYDLLPELTINTVTQQFIQLGQLCAFGIESQVSNELLLLLVQHIPSLQLISSHNVSDHVLQQIHTINSNIQYKLPFLWPNEIDVRSKLNCVQCRNRRTQHAC